MPLCQISRSNYRRSTTASRIRKVKRYSCCCTRAMHAQKVIAFRRSKLVDLQIIYAGKVLREESLLVKDFLRPVSIPSAMQIFCKATDLALLLGSSTLLLQKMEESVPHSLHLVIKTDARPAQQSTPHAHPASSAGPSGYAPPPFQPRAAQQVSYCSKPSCNTSLGFVLMSE